MTDNIRLGDTYRIQDLPIECTRKNLEECLRKSRPLPQTYEINILSLAIDHRSYPKTKVAVVSFTAADSLQEQSSLQPFKGFYPGYGRIELDSAFEGLTPLRGSAEELELDTSVDIIFVHGLGGHAVNTFIHRENCSTYFWPLERLSRSISSAQVWLWGYPSEVLGSTSLENLEDLAIPFADCLCSGRAPLEQRRAYILIGASLGGLIIKNAITILKDRQKDETLKRIAHLVMFGVPNQGMSVKTLRTIVKEQPNEQLILSLGPSSQVLNQLRRGFAKAFPYIDSRVYSFYETQQTKELINVDGKLVPSDDPPIELVTRHSATHGRWESESGLDYVRPINKDHSNIARFKKSEHSLRSVMSVLQECCDDAPTIVQKRFATVLIHQVMCKDAGLSMSSRDPQPFNMLTLDLMKKYREIYEALPRARNGTIEFETILNVFTDSAKIVSCEGDLRRSHQHHHFSNSATVTRIWTSIKPTTSPLSRNLMLAFLFLIHLEQNGVSLPASEFEPDSIPGTPLRLMRPRYRILIQFDDWTPCQCSKTCPMEWNFTNNEGLCRLGGSEPHSYQGSEPPLSDCALKKYRDNQNTWRRYNGEKLYKQVFEAWFSIRSKNNPGQ